MLTRRSLHILLTAGLLALSVGLKYWYKDSVVLTAFAKTISSDLAVQTQDFEETIQKYSAYITAQQAGQLPTSGDNSKIVEVLGSKPYTFFSCLGDSITFWSNNYNLPQTPFLRELRKQTDHSVVSTPAGYFYMLRRPTGAQEVLCLIPIKYAFGSNYLMRPNHFPVSASIPREVEVSTVPSGEYVIQSVKGKPVASLSAPARTVFKQPQRVELLLFLAFVLLYFSLSYNVAADMVKSRGMPAAVIFLLSALAFFFAIKIGFGLTDGFAGASVFGFSLESFGSLGDLLLTLGILLWLMIFFHKEHSKVRDQSNTPLVFRLVMATLQYLSVMISVVISLYILRQLVFSSSVVFDFDNLFNLDRYNLLLIGGVIMMMGAMFLYSHKLMVSLGEFGLTLHQRCGAIAVAGAFAASVYYFGFSLGFPVGLVIFFIITYVLSFDVFVSRSKIEFFWVLIWIGLYSFYAAMVLYHFNGIKDVNTRRGYAERLAIPRDTIAERELPVLFGRLDALAKSTSFSQSFGARGVPTSADVLLQQVRAQFDAESYLQLYYRTEIAVFAADRASELDLSAFTYGEMVDTFFTQGQTIIESNDRIKHYGHSPLTFRYTLRFKSLRLEQASEPLDVFVSFVPKSSPHSMVYNEVFFDRQYRNLEFLDKYDYVIFERGRPVYQKGSISQDLYDPKLFPAKGMEVNFVNPEKTRSDLLYTDPSGDVTVAVGRQTGGVWKRVYLASGIFTVLCLFMFCLVVINTSLKFLPSYYNFYIESRGSLSKRIQYYTVILIMLALISVGGLTWHSFKDSSQKNEVLKNDNLSGTMLKNMMLQLSDVPDHLDTQILRTQAMLPDFVKTFGIDIDIFSPDGRLVTTSAQELKYEGLMPQCMGAEAYYKLKHMHHSEELADEKTSGIPFKRKYYSLRNSSHDLIGFIGVPYYLPKHNINPSNSDFVGKVLTAFVILLVLGVVATLKISRGIISPLETIINKMKQQRLEEKHVPLVVDSYGEELVNLSVEYNNLIGKIEDFTQKLAERERDLAWREMAAMVAHEIKNAMTTIKLSLQNVHEAKKTNDEATITKFLDKAIYRNLMQVESLSRIAKDFGDFSMLQVPRRYPINLNKSVKDIFECFEEDLKAKYVLHLPDETIHTLGDEDSFIRVMNNLMLNAKEAIPDDREKRVDVTLYQEGDRAIIKVSDNGAGIPEEIQPSIFSPKFSTKSSGTGLGLSICKQIIEALDGKIYFKTVKDHGTDFVVELPVTDEATREVVVDMKKRPVH